MDLIRLAYIGSKPYNDKRHGSYTVWQPGDTKLVSATAARKLLKYVEFTKATAPEGAGTAAAATVATAPAVPKDPYEAAALAEAGRGEATQEQIAQQAQQAQQEQQASEEAAMLAKLKEQEEADRAQLDEKEAILTHIGTWDKDQLKDYAAKYEAKVNRTHSLQSIREQVTALVETYGVR